jgi:hypothetical protein
VGDRVGDSVGALSERVTRCSALVRGFFRVRFFRIRRLAQGSHR